MVTWMINMLLFMREGLKTKINVRWLNLDTETKYCVTGKAQCWHGDWRRFLFESTGCLGEFFLPFLEF